MKIKVLIIALVNTLVSGICLGQSAQTAVLEDFKPSILNQPGQEYPKVNSQGYARFRITAPKADSVKVSLGLGGRGGTKLAKSADGFWMGTLKAPWMKVFITII